MFEKYFVTCPVAITLRGAGFDEPCMAAWECNGDLEDENRILHIAYDSKPPNPAIYNEEIQALMKDRPGMFMNRRRNSEISPWLYAAPLYDQVFEWLFSKGIYLHPYYVSPLVIKDEGVWGCNLYESSTNNYLWPEYALSDKKEYHTHERRDVIEQAILAAIKLLPNESKMDV